MKKLEGKVAIVTGAASGIGRAIALLFAQEGAKVVVADIDDKSGEETVKMINERGGEAMFVHADVSKAEDVKNMVKITVERYGRLDVLVNNAGIEGAVADIVNYPEEAFDKVIAVNLKGVWLGIKYAVPEMVKSGGGSIINIASVLGLVGAPNMSGYCASKGGVVQLTKTAALEYAKYNIRVNAIAPGLIDTKLSRKRAEFDPEFINTALQFQVIKRMGRPEEVALAALYLASDDSSFVTGSCLVVDGGWTIA